MHCHPLKQNLSAIIGVHVTSKMMINDQTSSSFTKTNAHPLKVASLNVESFNTAPRHVFLKPVLCLVSMSYSTCLSHTYLWPYLPAPEKPLQVLVALRLCVGCKKTWYASDACLLTCVHVCTQASIFPLSYLALPELDKCDLFCVCVCLCLCVCVWVCVCVCVSVCVCYIRWSKTK